MKEEFPNISPGTVYRNLNQLSEAGIITKHSFGMLGTDHFDYNTSPHYHFVCDCCSAVIDLPISAEAFPAIDAEAAKDFDGLIRGTDSIFAGSAKTV